MAFDKNNTSLFMKIVIIIFAVILVLSLCLPFFSSCSAATAPTQDDSAQSASSSSEASTVAGIQEQYASLIASLESKLADDPGSLTYLASLGNNYMDEGVDMKGASDAADNEDTINNAFTKAIGYYDDYLEAAQGDESVDADSVSAVTVNRAICLFYSGDEDQAVSDLTAFLEETDDYVMGWYNLGAFYAQQGDNDKAKEAFNKVIELDPDNESGAVSYAQLQLAIIESNEQAAEEQTTDEETEDSGTDASDAASDTATSDADAESGADAADAESEGSDADASDADAETGTAASSSDAESGSDAEGASTEAE